MQEIKTSLTDEEKANVQLLEITDGMVIGVTDPDKLIGSLVLPEGITRIHKRAFLKCTALTRVVIPKSVTKIYPMAFADCISLTELTADSENSVYYTENNIIYTKDEKRLIAAAGNLTSVTIPADVTMIGSGAFSNCISLTHVTIPKSVTKIGLKAFAGCINLTELTIDSANPVYCSENNIIYTKDKKRLVTAAGSLKSIAIPDSVTKICWGAFSGCTLLTKVEIPDSVTEISSFAFIGCTFLASVTIPAGITNIGIFVFSGCTRLKTVIINAAGVKKIKADVFKTIYDDDDDDVHFTVKTAAVKAMLKKSCRSIRNKHITVDPNL